MPINLNNLNSDQLKKYIRTLSAGEILFEQDETGNTMFIVIHGSFSLLERRGDSQYLAGTVSAGQVLGEKAMLTERTYTRTYTARAESSATLLEFDNKNIKFIESVIPNFTSKILSLAAQRLDRANRIITLLRSMDPVKRVIDAIIFLASEDGQETQDGHEVRAGVDEIFQICHVEREIIEDCLQILSNKKLIQFKDDMMLIRDVAALDQSIVELKDRVAA